MINSFFLLGIFGGYEIIIIVAIALVLFGGKKLPEMMKNIGKGIKDVKKVAEENDLTKDIRDINSQINNVTSNVKKISSPAEFLKTKKK